MAATEEKDVEKTISEDLVVTKYKLAGEIVNRKYLLFDIKIMVDDFEWEEQ